MKLIPKTYLLFYLIGLSIFVFGLLLPYSSGLTLDKLNNSSTRFEFAPEYYETTIRGYESLIGKFNVLIIVLISLIFFLTKKHWFKLLLIPLGVLYFLSQVIMLISTIAGFGAPVGDSLQIGFGAMFFATIALIITTANKPTLKKQKPLIDF